MSSSKKANRRHQRGSALIIAMIFIVVFSALAVSMASLSGINVQLSENQRNVNSSLAAAESGLEVMRYYLSGLTIPGTVQEADRLSAVSTALQDLLSVQGASNISTTYNSEAESINLANVQLNLEANRSFNAVIGYGSDFDTLQIDVIGSSGQISRQIRVNFNFVTIGSTVFDFGVATKGPLQMVGQADIEAESLAIEGSVYIEGDNASGDAFLIENNASVAGDVTIANEYATYTAGDKCSVGGATGEDIADHVHVGADYAVFPTPDAEYFRDFATGGVIDDNHDWDNDSVLDNVIISANTNPTFSGNVIINGILFIEMPNVVKFTGQSVINGMIVASGDLSDNSGTNSITFDGQVQNNDVSTLEGSQFDAIKQETGTFILAPGFSIEFAGQALSVNGAIAGNGMSFSGQATGTVNGSIINYSTNPMMMTGQTTLTFNRSGAGSDPAGFVPNQTLAFQPESYLELIP